ncbi:MAG: cation-translocating P-type ATPase [Moheibacter sp.]
MNIPENLTGLTDKEVAASHARYGYNSLKEEKKNSFLVWLGELVKEPMLLLLIAVSVIYLIVGQYDEAIFMIVALIAVSGISFYQGFETRKALKEIEELNEPLSLVIRNSKPIKIPTHELAVGDLCVIEEGNLINADGKIVHSNDFSVNESSLTGETFSIYKSTESEESKVFSGTIVMSGLAIFEITEIGANTRLNKIGQSISEIGLESSPLSNQIVNFVKSMAIIGLIVFLMVWAYSFYQTKSIVDSLLNGLTLAMSILPEEIPVAFTTFMALGAWKLMQKNIIVKRSNVIETLGSTTVICTDKTGTITENSMQLKELYLFENDKVYNEEHFNSPELFELIEYAMWSSEPVPFDPMEKTIHSVYEKTHPIDKRKDFRMFHEYPLDGKPPMMTHLYQDDSGHRIIAAKGAPEAILSVSELTEEQRIHLRKLLKDFGEKGYRVLGVAKTKFDSDDFPKKQQDFKFELIGFTVFFDPPKQGIDKIFKTISDAGIEIKVITGDNPDTALAVARQAGIAVDGKPVIGSDLEGLSEEELIQKSEETTLFARMFPETKLAVVNALKKKGEIVAMLGDGVNDAPALKSANIGVAMGIKGTEIAKAAADLVIVNDNLDRLVVGIAEGRRIYANIKKAVQYIISIHIPIILTVSLPLFLGWIYPQIFTPIHVIFLELVMGPTCSIVYENEPMEKDIMLRKPRKITETFLNWKELGVSIAQGLMITLGILFIYQYSVGTGGDEMTTRAMVFSTLIFANIFLSLVNRSFYYSVFESFKNRNLLLLAISVIVLAALMLILYVPVISGFFKLNSLNASQLGMTVIVSAISVFWFELYKLNRRRKGKKLNYKSCRISNLESV